MGNSCSPAVAGDVFNGVSLCCPFFPHEMSWMRSGTLLNQFLRIFLPTFALVSLSTIAVNPSVKPKCVCL